MKYFQSLVFGLLIFGITYAYTSWLKIPGALNKSVADAGIILMGCSMLLSGICYFWNKLDSLIVYRRQLGVMGFAFGFVHIILSFSALQRLFMVETWQQGAMWPMLTGFLAAVIFGVMTLISNSFSARLLGGQIWHFILRLGYLAVIFTAAHVVFLRWGRWVTWYEQGMKTPPSTSLIVVAFMAVVLIMRLALMIALRAKKHETNTLPR